MNAIFDQSDLLMLFRFIAAHMITEWIFQWKCWRKAEFSKKWYSKPLWLGVAQGVVAGAIIFLAAWSWSWSSWGLFLIVLISRSVIVHWKPKRIGGVLVLSLKQVVYLAIIVFGWVGLTNINLKDLWSVLISVISDGALWVICLAYLAAVWSAGMWIGRLTEPWRKELGKDRLDGLAKAGLWVGRLERMLILTFVFLNRYEAIGFLIAAKSIFRFGEIKTSNDRKEAEYILIGTMLSFVTAILIGILAAWLLKKLQPVV